MARTFTAAAGQRLSRAAVLTSTPFTMACWFRMASTTGTRTLMSLANGSNNDDFWRLFHDSNEATVAARAGNSGSSETATSTAGASTGEWSHACGVFASDAARSAFLNGGNKGTNSNSLVLGSTVTVTGVGHLARASQDMVYDGDLAHAAIWNVALSDEEVALLAKAVSPLFVRRSALVAYWPLWGIDSPEPNLWPGSALALSINGTLDKADNPRIFLPY